MNIPLLLGILTTLSIIGVVLGIFLGTRPKLGINLKSTPVLVEDESKMSMMDWVGKYRSRDTKDDEIIDYLKKSGNPKGWTVADFKAARVQSALLFGGAFAGLVIVLMLLTQIWMLVALAPVFGGLGALFGYGQPKRTLIGAMKKRVIEVTMQMPSLLTAVALADGAGYTPEGALKLATDEMNRGTLKGEMQILLQLLASGSSFASALANFRERVPAPIVEEFTQKLYDAATTGQALATSLTDLAEVAFAERTAAMEMAAQKASQKIMFVVVPALILPADLIALMYPIGVALQSGVSGNVSNPL